MKSCFRVKTIKTIQTLKIVRFLDFVYVRVKQYAALCSTHIMIFYC